MKRPEEVKLSREDGEALRQRLEGDALTADDRRVLGQVLQWYFWLLYLSLRPGKSKPTHASISWGSETSFVRSEMT